MPVARYVRTLNNSPDDADLVTLDDGTGAAIRRQSDSAVMWTTVDAATAGQPTHPSLGTYLADYTALALNPTYAYTIYWMVAKSGLITQVIRETIEPADTSFTLRELCRKLAREVGRFSVVTTTALPTGTDAASTILSDSLVSASRSPTAFNGAYAYASTGLLAGEQRPCRDKGYTGTAGTVLVDRAFDDVLEVGAEVEFTWRLPRVEEAGVPGLRELVNRALKTCWFPDQLAFTATAEGVYQYDVTSYPWLRRQRQVGRIFGPTTGSILTGSQPAEWPGGVELRIDADLPRLSLKLPFKAGDTFYVEVQRPADTWIKSGGLWGESTVGLQSDTDEALCDPRLVVEVARAYAYELLAEIGEPDEAGRWTQKASEQTIKAARMRRDELPKIRPPRRVRGPYPLGPTFGRRAWLGRRSWI